MSLLLNGQALLSTEKLPGTVDGPVTKITETGHAQRWRRGGEHVLLEGSDAEKVFGFGSSVLASGRRLSSRGLLDDGLGGCSGKKRGGCRKETSGGHVGRRRAGEEPAETN